MPTPEPKIPSTKVLLISDNAKDALTFRMMSAEVKPARFEIIVSKSLADAFVQNEKERPGLALLDLALPGNKGLEMLLEFQKKCSSVPVVILTDRDNQAVAFEAVRQGAQDYLVKGKLEPNLLFHVMHYAIERHRVMSEMRKKNEELQRLNSLKSEFVSTVSHELRTPLTVILSAANNLLDGAFGALSDPQTKWVKKINQHSLRLHEMISDILDLSKLQSGKSQMRRDSIDFGKLIKATVTNLQMLAKEKKIMMSHQVAADLSKIWADPSRLEQVVTNLITNAIKYTPEEGRVKVFADQKDNLIHVSVEDTGMGIAPEHQEIIFDRFRQIRNQEKNESSTQGIGLGLAICKEIIDQHQGRIWVDSEMEKGSRFQFEVPLDPRAQAQPARHVLVVDDDVEISELMEMSLAQAGHHVTVSRNGKHAIQLVEENGAKFDLVFLDLMLPGASGVEVIKAIRQLKTPAEIVVVTAYPNSEMLMEGMSTGPLTIIAKPFNTDNILEMAARRKAA